jgi:hypothetical protein
MATRALGPMAGFHWFMHGVNLGRNNPRAVFGGALVVIVALLGLVLVLGMLASLVLGAGQAASPLVGWMLLLPVVAVVAGLLVGYLQLIDRVERGEPVRAAAVLEGFRAGPVVLRACGVVAILAVLQNLGSALAMALVAPEAAQWYAEQMANPGPVAAGAIPEGVGRAVVAGLALFALFFMVQAVAVGQVALRGRGLGRALADGASGAFRNLLPLLVLALIAFVVLLGIGVVATFVAFVVGLLAQLPGGAVLAAVLGVPVWLAATTAMLVVLSGTMYAMWRDITGDGTTADGAGTRHAMVA